MLFCLAVPLTSLLFFFRARAVFGRDPFAVAFFGVLWLGVLGGCLTTIPGIGGANIGPTPYCTTGVFKFYAVAAAITPLINDGIVFFAITWRLWRNTWARRTVKNGVRALVYGDYLPMFSKSLLQDGQIYFLSAFSYFRHSLRQLMILSTGPRSVPIFWQWPWHLLLLSPILTERCLPFPTPHWWTLWRVEFIEGCYRQGPGTTRVLPIPIPIPILIPIRRYLSSHLRQWETSVLGQRIRMQRI